MNKSRLRSLLTLSAALLAVSVSSAIPAHAKETTGRGAAAMSQLIDAEKSHGDLGAVVDGSPQGAGAAVSSGASNSDERLSGAAKSGLAASPSGIPIPRTSRKPGFGDRLAVSAGLPFRTGRDWAASTFDALIGPKDHSTFPFVGGIIDFVDHSIRNAEIVILSPVFVVAAVAGAMVGAGKGLVNLFTGENR